MTHPSTHDEPLTVLRQAADRGDVDACRSATALLLSRMPLHRALELTRLQVARRLPAFELHQPGVIWPRQLLEHLERDTLPQDWVWPTDNDDFPGPGANNFIQALDSLWQASLHLKEYPGRLEALVDALTGLIIMDKLVEWGSRNPELWARWYRTPVTSDPSLLSARLDMVHNPEAERRFRLGWRDIAQACAEALGLD